MLGYVLPDKGELKLREYEIYSGYYCGICKYIGRTYGQLPRMSLSYDAAFLAMLLACVDNTPDDPKSEHCAVHHIRYKTIIRNTAIEYAGDVMLILAWHKLADDARDEGKLYAKATMALFKKHYDKLRVKYPALCERIEAGVRELSDLEGNNCDSIDRVAEPFAQILQNIFKTGSVTVCGQSELHETFAKIGYHLGKWIYLIDAVDDIEENIGSGSYNPLLHRFGYDGATEDPDAFRRRIDENLRFNLFHYLAVIGESAGELDIKKNSGIIENIIYFGLNRRSEEVLRRIETPKRGFFGPRVYWENKEDVK